MRRIDRTGLAALTRFARRAVGVLAFVWVCCPVVLQAEVQRDYWTGISGSAVSALTADPRYPASPTGVQAHSFFEAPIDWGDNHGQRLWGYLIAPVSGTYTFWIASDDDSELWLSTDTAPSNTVKIAYVTGWCNSREWTKYGSQTGTADLTAGQLYYIEALHKEGTGGDNVAVGWQLPSGGALERPIPGSRVTLSLIPPLLARSASGWRYAKGTQEASIPDRTAWRAHGFDDSGWSTGAAPFRYGVGSGGMALSDMSNTYSSVFLRKQFTVTNAASITALQLKVRFDDGFVAWINGNRVADNNEPDALTYNALADGYHTVTNSDFATFGLSENPATLLSNGVNVLAIQAFNVAVDDTEFYLDAELNRAVADTKFSQDRGFYDVPFDLTITTVTPGATIFATTDGRAPSAGDSDASGTSPLVMTISNTTPVRAMAAKAGDDPTDVDTHTYIFLADVMDQTKPADYPNPLGTTDDGQSVVPDYDMDPDVVYGASYRDMITNAFKMLPTVSVVLHKDDLFGPTGFYNKGIPDRGNNTPYPKVTKPCSAELFYADGSHADFQINCGVKGHSWPYRPKRSIRLHFLSEYGPPKLRHDVFAGAVMGGETAVKSFDKLVLRAGGNMSLLAGEGQAADGVYVRDRWARETQNAMNGYCAHGLFVHLYLNGLYWGVYELAEKPDDHWRATYEGGQPEDYFSAKGGRYIAALNHTGDRTHFDNFRSSTSKSVGGGVSSWSEYQTVCNQYVRMDELCDYMALCNYNGVGDWFWYLADAGNWYVGCRSRGGFGRLYYVVWDAEDSWYIVPYSSTRCNNGAWINYNLRGYYDTSSYPYNWDNIWQGMLQRPEHKIRFSDRVYKQCFNDGPLTVANATNRWLRLANHVEDPLVCEYARWGDYRHDWAATKGWDPEPVYTRDGNWYSDRDYVTGLMSTNVTRFIQVLRAEGWYPSIDPPTFSQNGGEIVAGFALSMSQTDSGTIFYTVDGSDPRDWGTGAVAGTQYTGPLTNITQTTHVKARLKNGGEWSALAEATFHVAFSASDLRITEIMYHPADDDPQDPTWLDDDFEFIEFRNVGGAALDLSGYEVEGVGPYVFGPGTTLAAGGYLVLVRNPAAFSNRYPGVTQHGVYSGGLANDGERIRVKDPVGNTVLSVRYEDRELNMVEDDLGFWPLAADGLGYSLVNVNTAGDPDNPENWRASKLVNGSPGAADAAPSYGLGVVINEVLAHSDLSTGDAIELYNTTASPVDIGGWYLSDEFDRNNPDQDYNLKKYQIPATNVPAYGRVVFYQTNAAHPFGFGIKEDGTENVYLASASAGNLSGYIIGLNLPATSNGVSVGRHQTSEGLDFAVQSARTFGTVNSAPQVGPIVINEIMYNPPETGTSTNEYVELKNISGGAVDIGGWDLEGAGGYVFPTGTVVQAGSYLVLVDTNNGTSPAQFRSTHGIPGGVPVLGHGFTLGNNGESMRLERPNDPVTDPDVFIEKVCYNDKSPWPTEAAGEGPSLERYDAGAYGNDPLNWRASNLGGTPGAANTFVDGLAIVAGSAWKYHALGLDLGEAWRTNAYNDASWPSGDAALGYANDPGTLGLVTLVPYGPNPSGKYPTTYFRKEFSISDDPAEISALTLDVRYDDGFVAYLNGVEVLRRSMGTSGPVAYTNWADAHDGASWEEDIDLSAHTDKLVQGRNLLAVEVHQTTPTSSDLVWDARLSYSISTLPTVAVHIEPASQSFTDPLQISITSTPTSATIHYTTDGSTPTTGSPTYSGAFSVSGQSTTVRALGIETDYNNGTASKSYTYQPRVIQFATGLPTGGTENSAGTVTLTVQVSPAAPGPVSVDYALNVGASSATRDNDFTMTDGTATIAAGLTTTSFTFTVLGDVVAENDETVVVDLDNPSAGLVLGARAQHIYTITDDDAPTDVFVAYNDLAWDTGQTTANISIHGLTESGQLVDYDTGSNLTATLSVSAGGNNANFASPHMSQLDTEAYEIFNGIVNVDRYIEYTTNAVLLTFANLNSDYRYECVLFGNRNGGEAYEVRTTVAQIQDCASFVNGSTNGATISQTAEPNDTTATPNGWNPNGYVTRYKDIAPGSDGDFTIKIHGWSGSGYPGRYYLNALMLKCTRTGGAPEPVEKIARGSAWRWRKGTAEASDPVAAWRGLGFDDSGWAVSNACFGYGDPGVTVDTDLSDMRYNYTCIFMRKQFTVACPALVSEVRFEADYDDGFVMWLNGEEIFRTNMGVVGSTVAYTNTASNAETSCSVTLEKGKLPVLGRTNVLAVQAFNVSRDDSSDFGIDVALSVVEGSATAGDGDGDGMPDDWENDMFGGTSAPDGGTEEDYDGDGQPNMGEWICGTDASNSNDYFAVQLAVSGADVIVSFPIKLATGTGYAGLTRHYALEKRLDMLLLGGTWLALPGYEDIEATGDGTVSYTNTSGAVSYFRGRVWLD